MRLSDSMLDDDDRAALESIVGPGAVSSDRDQRLGRARGKSYLDLLDWRSGDVIEAPDVCVAPGSAEEILAVLELCSERGIAVVPFGGGSSVVGGVNPERGRHGAVISVDLARFRDVEDLDEVSGEVTLGAGLTGPEAERLLGEKGWSLGHFPQSFPYATIGGDAATRSSGQDSAGYGRFDDMVRGLTVVTPTGIADTGRAPEVVRHEAYRCPDLAAGAAGLREVAQLGAGPTVIRLSDESETMVNLAGATDGIGEVDLDPGCLCITMYEGPGDAGADSDVEARMARTRAILEAHGGRSLGEEPARAWEHGRFGAPVLRDALIDAGALCETLETATTWSNIPALHASVAEAVTSALALAPAFVLCHISHVYDTGASLCFTVVAAQSEDPRGQWRATKDAASRAIVDGGGTITHHHAVGSDHRPYLADEIGDVGAVALVKSPRAGHGCASHAAERAMARLTERGVSVVGAQGCDEAASRDLLAEVAADERVDALVVVGGDGMINLALQVQAGTGLPLGIIPAGTGNDHTREYHLPSSPEAAADVVAAGFAITTDLGRITADDGTSRWFGTVMCSGFDSLVSDRVNSMTWPRGRMRYNLAIVAEFLNFHSLPFRITLDDGTALDDPVTLAAFGNTRSYGGGMKICPTADHSDGLLDVTVVGRASRTKAALTFSKVFTGEHVEVDEVTVHRTRSARRVSRRRRAPRLRRRGRHGPLPVTVEAVPAAGRYLVPRP